MSTPTPTTPGSPWPFSYSSFVDKVNQQDYILAEHVNILQAELLALEHAIGLTPQGTFSTVSARLANYDAQMVTVSGNQTITGTKAFTLASATGFRVLADDTALIQPGSLGPLSVGFDGGTRIGINNSGVQVSVGTSIATLNVQPYGGLTKFGGAIDTRPNQIQTDLLDARTLYVRAKSHLDDVDFYLHDGLTFHDDETNRPTITLKWLSAGMAFCDASGTPLVTITNTGDIVTAGITYAGLLIHSSSATYPVAVGTTWVGPAKSFAISQTGTVLLTVSFGVKYFDEIGFSATFGVRVNGVAATAGPEARWDYEPTGFILDESLLDYTAMTGGPSPADYASKVITVWAPVAAETVAIAPTVTVNSIDPHQPSVTIQGFSITGTVGRVVPLV